MGFMQNLKYKLQNFLRTRYGTDLLSHDLTMFALPLLVLGLFPYVKIVAIPLAYFCIFYSMFRMFSKNPAARRKENVWYMEHTQKPRKAIGQYYARFQNRKTYKYFRCPKCHSWLKLKRGAGEGTVKCGKCGNEFQKKA